MRPSVLHLLQDDLEGFAQWVADGIARFELSLIYHAYFQTL